MARKTREAALETRQHLLDAAEGLFDRQGVAATTLQQIATQAGATRGAVYWHFRGKPEILDALLQDRVRQPLADLAESLLAASPPPHLAGDPEPGSAFPATDPLTRVRALVMGLAEGIADSPAICRVMGIAVFKVERGVDNNLRRVMGQRRTQGISELQKVIQTALAHAIQTENAHPEADQATQGLVLIFDGLLTGWLMDLSDAPEGTVPAPSLPERLRHIMDAYLRGLGLGG